MIMHESGSIRRFHPLVHRNEEGVVQHVHKVYDDSDFVHLDLDDKDEFRIKWATGMDALQSVEAVHATALDRNLTFGTVALRQSLKRSQTGIGGVTLLYGEPVDIVETVKDTPRHVVSYSFDDNTTEIGFRPSWPRTYTTIRTNEIFVRMGRQDKAAHYVVSSLIKSTALEGFSTSKDTTFVELSQYLPILTDI